MYAEKAHSVTLLLAQELPVADSWKVGHCTGNNPQPRLCWTFMFLPLHSLQDAVRENKGQLHVLHGPQSAASRQSVPYGHPATREASDRPQGANQNVSGNCEGNEPWQRVPVPRFSTRYQVCVREEGRRGCAVWCKSIAWQALSWGRFLWWQRGNLGTAILG